MKVILRENVANTGKVGDVVKVSDGFGRNYLLPRNLAVLANERNLSELDHFKRIISARMAKIREMAQKQITQLDGLRIEMNKHVGEGNKLFGSVTAREIADLLRDKGFNVDKHDVILSEPLKTAGEFQIRVKLHPEVSGTITVAIIAAD